MKKSNSESYNEDLTAKIKLREYNDLLKESMQLYGDSSRDLSIKKNLEDYLFGSLEEKKTYKQKCPEYNLAKTNESTLFKKLLSELLLLSIEEDDYPKVGRKGYSIKEKLFAMCIKIYYKSDLRKCQSILFLYILPCPICDQTILRTYLQKSK